MQFLIVVWQTQTQCSLKQIIYPITIIIVPSPNSNFDSDTDELHLTRKTSSKQHPSYRLDEMRWYDEIERKQAPSANSLRSQII